MRHHDFGHLDGPVVLFGGAYSNLQATLALFEAAGSRDMVSTGDLVAYCADPVATVTAFLGEDCRGIAGNCERQLADGADDCGCGFGDGSACDLLSRGWYSYLRRTITDEAIDDLSRLPDIGSFEHQGRRYAVIHGGATAINRYIWPSSQDSVFREEINAIEAAIGPVDGIVAGHCGIAFQRLIGKHHWINAGAIGLPPHDGRPETRHAVLDGGEVTMHRLHYDHAAARDAMERVGLTQGYHETLETGIWPSEDVLPPELRR
ncbi:MAG: metallophosphoesterase [Silicimonas sp.]|nr:metallophosphoesterase [Silicimonas sp.]